MFFDAIRNFRVVVPVAGALSLAGCAGVDAVTHHAELDVHTHMSETVFLDPAPASAKTVYIGVRNMSDYAALDIRAPLVQAIQARGYAIVDDPAQAHYMLQANVLQAGKLAPAQEGELLAANYGQPVLMGAAAGGLTGVASGNGYAGLGAGLGVTAVSWAMNQAYTDVTYAVTTDIQISERPLSGGKVTQHTHNVHARHKPASSLGGTARTPYGAAQADPDPQNSSERTQDVDEESDYKKYQVRDVAYADRVNLTMEEAVPALVGHLTSSLANVFE